MPTPIILHITRRQAWDRARGGDVYRADSLDSEGFLHCSHPEQLVRVANTFFAGQSGLVVLCIDAGKVQPAIKDESRPGSPETFPHIYGALNLDAVVDVVPLEPGADGTFAIPRELDPGQGHGH
jgi:uncharacterized protein (DUF952 family)